MTGRYPMRHGLQTLVIFPSHTYGLPTDELTLPQALKDAGYRTLMVGKWHLGHADRKYWPQNRGFDHFYGNVVGEVDYFTKRARRRHRLAANGKFLKEDGYYTTLIGNEAVEADRRAGAAQPFFLYFASLAPHAPYQAPQGDASTATPRSRSNAAHVCRDDHELDDQVGRIVAALEKRGCARTRSSSSPATTAAPRARCSRPGRGRRKNARERRRRARSPPHRTAVPRRQGIAPRGRRPRAGHSSTGRAS